MLGAYKGQMGGDGEDRLRGAYLYINTLLAVIAVQDPFYRSFFTSSASSVRSLVSRRHHPDRRGCTTLIEGDAPVWPPSGFQETFTTG